MSRPAQLRAYQSKIVSFLEANPRANIYAGMGLGKTLSVLSWIRKLGLSRVLVLAPLRVARDVWAQEGQAWDHLTELKISCICGTSPQEREQFLRTPAHVRVLNYDNLPWLVEHFGVEHWPFTTVVADESTRLKGLRLKQGAKRAAVLRPIAHRKIERWVNLSGTPAANGLKDLWGPQWLVDGGRALGRSYDAFEHRWFYQKIGSNGMDRRVLPFAHSQREIEEAIRSTTLSIRAQDYFDLEEPIVKQIVVDLPPRAREAYRTMSKQFYAELLDGTVTAVNAGVKTLKLLQIASGILYRGEDEWSELHDVKLQALESIIEEAAGAPVLVSYTFVADCERIKKAFPKAVEIRETGAIERWNKGEIPILLAHPKSAGHGLNLQHGGNILVFFGTDWNLEEHLQIIERIGPTRQRQSGYDRPVWVYYITARSTIDEVVLERQKSKREVLELLLESLKSSE